MSLSYPNVSSFIPRRACARRLSYLACALIGARDARLEICRDFRNFRNRTRASRGSFQFPSRASSHLSRFSFLLIIIRVSRYNCISNVRTCANTRVADSYAWHRRRPIRKCTTGPSADRRKVPARWKGRERERPPTNDIARFYLDTLISRGARAFYIRARGCIRIRTLREPPPGMY